VPETMDPELLDEPLLEPLVEPLEELLEEATLEAAGGATETDDAVPPVMADADPVPFWAMAICWNMAWVLLAVGLMEKVMPFPQ